MAVEAPHMTLFHPQILPNRDMINQGNRNVYDDGARFGYGIAPISATATETETVQLPMDMVPAAKVVDLKADSGLTFTYSLPLSRKRSRDSSSFDPLHSSSQNAQFVNQNELNNYRKGTFTFLGEDISMLIYQQQLEIDRLIAHHMEKVRTEIEERGKRNSRRLIAAAGGEIMKRLRTKEEEIVKIGKLNWALEEKLKSLGVDNQIWRELAQTNEATANTLRSNLEKALAQIQEQNQGAAEDAQSSCGGNYEDDEHHHQHTSVAVSNPNPNGNDGYCTSHGGGRSRWCRSCGKEESLVVVLPCRHLCLCTVCASSVNVCPICNSTMNATVHVNF